METLLSHRHVSECDVQGHMTSVNGVLWLDGGGQGIVLQVIKRKTVWTINTCGNADYRILLYLYPHHIDVLLDENLPELWIIRFIRFNEEEEEEVLQTPLLFCEKLPQKCSYVLSTEASLTQVAMWLEKHREKRQSSQQIYIGLKCAIY